MNIFENQFSAKEMKFHQLIFSRIKEILQKHFGSNLIISEENGDTFLEIRNSDFYIKSNEVELTVGFGTIHTHFSEDFENLDKSIDCVYKILTNQIQVTKFIKGNYIFKVSCEIIYEKSKNEIFGGSRIILYPFWKKEKVEVIKYDKLIEGDKVSPDFEKLKNDLEKIEDDLLLKLMLEAKEEGFSTEKEFFKALKS